MPFQRGHKRFGGRQKDENKIFALRSAILGVPFDWRKFAKQFPETYARIAGSLVPKSLEVSGPGGNPLQVESVLFARKADAKD